MNPKNLYNVLDYNPGQDWKDWVYENVYQQVHMKEITLHAPIATAHADNMIRSLYGEEKLREVDALTIYDHRCHDSQLELYLYTQLLPKEPIRIDKMDARIANWEYIIPASAITQQYVNNQTKEITIPIEAFDNKSTLVFHRDNPDTGQGMLYHYIFLQSAKDPNIAQPISIFRGMMTDKLCTVFTNEQLKGPQGWEIKVQQGDALLKYMDHFTKAWPDIPAMARGPLKISIPKGLYEIATQGQNLI